jgi:hypothetical protein
MALLSGIARVWGMLFFADEPPDGKGAGWLDAPRDLARLAFKIAGAARGGWIE